MLRFAAAAVLCLAATPSFAQVVTISPEQIGQIFCISRLGNDMAPVEGLLTAELSAAIAEAEAKNDAIQQAHPDEKPPLGDGIPWQAFPDYADQCEPTYTVSLNDMVTVRIAYGFKGSPEANFEDSLMLKQVRAPDSDTKRFRIDNIHYGTGGDLRSVLVAAFAN